MIMPQSKIGVTLYNLREFCKTADALDVTLAKVKAIGYQAIQISGIGPIPPEKVKELADKHGLFICATHEGLPAYRDNFDAVVAKMKLWNCDFTALGYPGSEFFNAEGAVKLAVELESLAKKFLVHGIKLGYHNHADEMERFTAKTFLEEIYSRTTTLCAEIDTHWIARGGGCPAAWIRRVAGRMPVVHFKDLAHQNKQSKICEVGEGNLNWPAIIKACEETNVRWYVVEQDEPNLGRDIFDSIKISFEHLAKLGVK